MKTLKIQSVSSSIKKIYSKYLNINKPISFVLTSTNHGTMIVNKNDFNSNKSFQYGVGHQLLTSSSFDQVEIDVTKALIAKRRQYYKDEVLVIDCGANIGVHTIEWAKMINGWGRVLSFEAQDKLFYALAGNIVLNNCLNVTAENYVIGKNNGNFKVPALDFNIPSSFGSLELKKSSTSEYIGQELNPNKNKETKMISLDSLNLNRCDFIKIDVEGMEEEVLLGSKNLINKCRPILLIEHIKSNNENLTQFFEKNFYKLFYLGINILAVHESDYVLKDLIIVNDVLEIK